MNKIILSIFLTAFLSFPTVSYSQETPEQTLSKILSDIKTSASTTPVVNYVDWEKAFNNLSEEKRKKNSISSSQEMKSYYENVLKNPIAIMEKQYKKKIASLTPQQKPIFEQNFARLKSALEEKTKEMSERIAESEYEVGVAKVTGDIAIVPLKRKYIGKTTEENVRLEKSGDKWLLPGVNSLSAKKQN